MQMNTFARNVAIDEVEYMYHLEYKLVVQTSGSSDFGWC